LYGIVV